MTSILEGLRRLDAVLAAAADRLAAQQERPPDSFRGLYIDPEDIAGMSEQEPAAPRLWSALVEERAPRIEWLEDAFELSPFDLDVVLLSLAPELDLRYERLYAYLQDDVTRRRPTVDLALNLLCSTPEARIRRRAHFAHQSPLRRHDVIRLVADPAHVDPPLLSHYLRLDEQILCVLLDQPATDPQLASFCRWPVAVATEDWPMLRRLAGAAHRRTAPLHVYVQGPDRHEREAAAAAVAAEAGAPLLIADLAQAPAGTAQVAAREAWLRGAVLYAEGIAELPETPVRIAILGGSQPGAWQGALNVRLGVPDFAARSACWCETLKAAGIELSPAERSRLASCFILTRRQIRAAADAAAHHAAWRGADFVALEDLFAACRAESGHALAALARKVTPRRGWDDIVLPADLRAHLRELCCRASLGRRVLDDWGFDRRLSSGKGVSAVFAGPSGTGKTLAAEIVAAELRLDLYKIELSGVVSKYIGETEKNLDRIFTAAENANAILFFDEAEALFGKRSEVHDSHDRYANIEIAYLLQKMEEYEGIAILATNLRHHLDDSFTRRLTFCLQFPFPDEHSRRLIWESVWPAETPMDGVDSDFLARRFKLSGGNIRNIALAAAFLAADAESPVTMDHLMQAARREFQKLGKQLSVAELQQEVAS